MTRTIGCLALLLVLGVSGCSHWWHPHRDHDASGLIGPDYRGGGGPGTYKHGL